MKFGIHIHALLKMKCTHFGDPLTFHPSTCSKFQFVQHKTATLMTFPSASVVLCVNYKLANVMQMLTFKLRW